jgi:hypothetical protein
VEQKNLSDILGEDSQILKYLTSYYNDETNGYINQFVDLALNFDSIKCTKIGKKIKNIGKPYFGDG